MSYKDLKQQNAYQRTWQKRRRMEWLSGQTCAHCGSDKNLEVDHIDPSNKISHRIWSWKLSRRLEELRKCQVLCRQCHKFKSIAEKGLGNKHGSRYSRGCRCEICTAYHRNLARATYLWNKTVRREGVEPSTY